MSGDRELLYVSGVIVLEAECVGINGKGIGVTRGTGEEGWGMSRNG